MHVLTLCLPEHLTLELVSVVRRCCENLCNINYLYCENICFSHVNIPTPRQTDITTEIKLPKITHTKIGTCILTSHVKIKKKHFFQSMSLSMLKNNIMYCDYFHSCSLPSLSFLLPQMIFLAPPTLFFPLFLSFLLSCLPLHFPSLLMLL